MADIVDTMFGWFMDIIGWLIKLMGKIIVGLITVIINLIKSLFSKQNKQVSDTHSATEGTEKEPVKLWLYENFVSDINNLQGTPLDEEFNNKISGIILNLLVNFNIPLEEKCKGLEFVDGKMKEFYGTNQLSIGTVWVQTIKVAYNVLCTMTSGESTIMNTAQQNFEDDVQNSNLKPLQDYLIEILTYVGALASADGSCTFDSNLLEKYSLPQWPWDA